MAIQKITGFANLKSIQGSFLLGGNLAFRTVQSPAFAKLEEIDGYIQCGGANWDQASVDYLLAMAVRLKTLQGNPWIGTIHLNGGTSAAPSSAGLASKSILQGRGATVYTN